MEEKILYPTSAKKLNNREWIDIKLGEPEIGYAWITPSNLWDAQLAKATQPEPIDNQKEIEMSQNDQSKIQLSQGLLTAEQIDLMSKNLIRIFFNL